MAGLLDFFSGGGDADLYGGLLSEAQRSALATRGLASMAEKFAQMAMPSKAPIPLGAVLGSGFGAYGAGTDEALKTAFEAQYKAAQAKKLQSEIEYAAQSGPYFDKIIAALGGLGGPGGGGPLAAGGSGSTGGAAVSPGAGGGGSGTYWTPEGLAALRPTEGRYDQIHYPSGNPSTATGAYGFLDSTWREQAAKAGVDIKQYPRAYLAPPEVQDKVAAITPIHHWTGVDAQGKPFNAAAQRLATNRAYVAGGAPSAAAAPAPAAGGGLLNLPDPTGTAARAGFGLLQGGANTPTVPLQQLLNKNRQDFGDFGEGSGSSAAAPEDIYAGYPTTAEQAGGGEGPVATAPIPPPLSPLAIPDLPPQAAAALAQAVPNLLRGGGGLLSGAIPGMPPASAASPDAMPSDDPRLQLGPLAPAPTVAPAAAAAPGPGLLAPGALPGTAPATPRGVNPAYGQVAAAIAAAALQASRAGMKTEPFDLLLRSLTTNPAYQAELKRGEKGVELEYAPAIKDAEKAVELRYAAAIADATSRGNLPSQIILKNVEAQNDLRNKVAPLGFEITYDKDGKGTMTPLTGAAKTMADQAAATAEATERGRLTAQQGSAPGLKREETFMGKVGELQAGEYQQADAAAKTLYALDDTRDQLRGAGIFSGLGANAKLTVAKWGAAAGLPNDRIRNTEIYLIQAGKQAVELLRSGAFGAGSGISEGDRQAANRLAGGDTTLDLATIKRILDLTEQGAYQTIERYNAKVAPLQKKIPDAALRVEAPPRFIGMTGEGRRVYQSPDGTRLVRD